MWESLFHFLKVMEKSVGGNGELNNLRQLHNFPEPQLPFL